jgi:hypothetical protein
MKTQLAVSAIALPLCLLGLTSPAWAQDGRHGEADFLASWQVEVTPTAVSVCGGPSVPVPPSFTELVTFDAGGGFHETNSQLNWIAKTLFPGLMASASDGFGTWTKRGTRTHVEFRKLLFDAAGAYIGNVAVREIVEDQQHDWLPGKFTIEFKFLDGNPSVCGSGDVGGVLIRPDVRP